MSPLPSPSLPLRFVRLCEYAYLILCRRVAHFINLLAMIIETGIPELHTIDDLNYVSSRRAGLGSDRERGDSNNSI